MWRRGSGMCVNLARGQGEGTVFHINFPPTCCSARAQQGDGRAKKRENACAHAQSTAQHAKRTCQRRRGGQQSMSTHSPSIHKQSCARSSRWRLGSPSSCLWSSASRSGWRCGCPCHHQS
jgi:hypothetical protein